MSDIEVELAAIQQQLKKYAEQLGQINLSNNQYQQSNEQLSSDIIALTNKINKKKHQIEQENKDKLIIHQKLVKAERVKEELEIKHSQQKEKKERERKARELQERQREQEEKAKQQQRLREVEKARKELMDKHSPKKIEEKVVSAEVRAVSQKISHKHEEPVRQQKPLPEVKPTVKPTVPVQQVKAEIKLQAVANFDNSDKGEYQPPALFLDENSDDEEQDDEDNSKMLQLLKSKLRLDSKELHDNEDDD